MNDVATAQPTTAGWQSRLGALSPHFAILSALAAVVGALCSTIFLYAYLSVFDWHLIWIIEYGDILKFGLVVVAIISGFFYWIYSIADDVIVWMTPDADRDHTAKKVLGAMFFLSFASFITSDETSNNPHFALHFYMHLSVIVVGFLSWYVVVLSRNGFTFNARTILNDLSFFVIAMGIFGHTLGFYVRDFGDYRQDVTLKDNTLQNVRIIMITSHHIMLYANGQTITVPSGDVTKIVSKPEKISKPEEN